MEVTGFEPVASRMRSERSTPELYPQLTLLTYKLKVFSIRLRLHGIHDQLRIFELSEFRLQVRVDYMYPRLQKKRTNTSVTYM